MRRQRRAALREGKMTCEEQHNLETEVQAPAQPRRGPKPLRLSKNSHERDGGAKLRERKEQLRTAKEPGDGGAGHPTGCRRPSR